MNEFDFNDLDPHQPISTTHQAGCLVDLILSARDRADNSLYIGALDDDGFPIKEMQIVVGGIPLALSSSEIEELFARFVDIPFSQAVVAVGTPYRPAMEDLRRWQAAAARIFAPDADKKLVGFFAAYLDRVIDVPPLAGMPGAAFFQADEPAA